MEVEEGPPIVKAASNLRSYKLIKLRNGLAALLIHDPEVDNDDNPDEEENDGEAAEDMDVEFDVEEEPGFPFGWPHFQYNCTGLSGDDFMSDMKLRLGFHPVGLQMKKGVQTEPRF